MSTLPPDIVSYLSGLADWQRQSRQILERIASVVESHQAKRVVLVQDDARILDRLDSACGRLVTTLSLIQIELQDHTLPKSLSSPEAGAAGGTSPSDAEPPRLPGLPKESDR